MLKVTGNLLNIIPKSEFKQDDGLTVPTKAKLQLLVDEKRANGSIVKKLHTISIPDEKIALYKNSLQKEVSVDVSIISKSYSFYGI